MRKYISLLLFICSLNIFAAELPPAPQPETLIAAMSDFCEKHCNKSRGTKYSYMDENGLPSLSTEVYPFSCSAKDSKLNALLKAFVTDEKNGYQYVHELPNKGQLYSVSINDHRTITRKSIAQEFYMLCAKNFDNPRLRDMYAIAFVKKSDGNKDICEGSVFKIRSKRPDYTEAEANDVPKWQEFTLDGILDKEFRDSIKYVRFRGFNPNRSTVANTQHYRWREPVYRGHFVYKDKFNKITDLEISYIYANGKLSPWQTIKCTPGTTLYVNLHRNGYDISKMEINSTGDVSTTDRATMTKTEEAMKTYGAMLKSINEQIRELRKVPPTAPDHESVTSRLKKLHTQAEDITNKMQELVEKVAKELE